MCKTVNRMTNGVRLAGPFLTIYVGAKDPPPPRLPPPPTDGFCPPPPH